MPNAIAIRLTSVTDGVSTSTFAYNGDGDRVSQTVDGTLTTYVLDTATPLTMVLVETTGEDSIYYLHGLDLVAQSDGTNTEYFAYDGLGSVRQVVDEAAVVLLAQTYDPYGGVYASAGPGETHYGWTGEQVDASGLVYLRARYYNPSMGRFFQRDTWEGDTNRPQSLNPYLYGLDNPTNHIDPSGMCTDSTCEKLARSLERTYDLVIFWPDRDDARNLLSAIGVNFSSLTPEQIVNLIALGECPDTTFHELGQAPANIRGSEETESWLYNPRLLTWTYDEMRRVADAFGWMSNVIELHRITEGGVLYRADVMGFEDSALGLYCLGGNCDTASPFGVFAGAAYSIGFSHGWDQYTVLHEFGHRANSVVGITVDDALWIEFLLFGAPTDNARSNSREYFADTFAMFIWEDAHAGSLPARAGAVSLANIPNARHFHSGRATRSLLQAAWQDIMVPLGAH